MKKFFSMLAFGLLFVSSASAQTAKILRHSKGQVIQYKASEISTAIGDAVAGDTLYLSDGVFGGFTITKPISIIGTGQETRITGSVDISIPDNPSLTSRLLDAMNISGTLCTKLPVSGMNIRKCYIEDVSFSSSTTDAIIDRCYINNSMTLSSNVNSLAANNSSINFVSGSAYSPDNASFINCNIYRVCTVSYDNSVYSGWSGFQGNLVNCIISYFGSSPSNSNSNYKYLTDGVYAVNCLFYSDINTSKAVIRNCYSASPVPTTKSELTAAGYLGNDGTVVGRSGGNTPYTLTPSTPTVTSSKIAVDNEKKQLNVNITVKSNN